MVRTTAMALLTTLALVACSDGDSTSDPDTGSQRSALSKSQYIAKADAICKDAELAINNLDPPATHNDLDNYAEEVTNISEDAIADLRSLEPPPEDTEVLAQIVNNIERSVRLLPDYVRASQAQDAPRVQEIESELQTIQQETGHLASDYGFEECGGDEGAPHT